MVFTIRANIEVLGFPEDHVKEVMNKVIEKLKTEEGMELLKQELTDTAKIKEKFFSTFVEVEMKMHDFAKLLNFCYDYLPSGLEILDTEKITMPIREFSFGLNEMLGKLHHFNILINNLSTRIEQLEGDKKEN